MTKILSAKAPFFVVLLLLFSRLASAQVPAEKDTVSSVTQDTTVTGKKSDEKKEKRKSTIILYTGINFNKLKVSSDFYESTSRIGWHLGAAYRQGGFFYWQLGARFNDARYEIRSVNSTDTTHDSFDVTELDIPLTAGINFLSFANRVGNVRVFVSAVPAIGLSVSDNTLGVEKDNTNSFNLYGQAGLGVDVLFLVIEGGFNYGFSDLLKDDDSNPGQVFINLGFRF
jgi:hypothetical protein